MVLRAPIPLEVSKWPKDYNESSTSHTSISSVVRDHVLRASPFATTLSTPLTHLGRHQSRSIPPLRRRRRRSRLGAPSSSTVRRLSSSDRQATRANSSESPCDLGVAGERRPFGVWVSGCLVGKARGDDGGCHGRVLGREGLHVRSRHAGWRGVGGGRRGTTSGVFEEVGPGGEVLGEKKNAWKDGLASREKGREKGPRSG
jgi:hypothetical protein